MKYKYKVVCLGSPEKDDLISSFIPSMTEPDQKLDFIWGMKELIIEDSPVKLIIHNNILDMSKIFTDEKYYVTFLKGTNGFLIFFSENVIPEEFKDFYLPKIEEIRNSQPNRKIPVILIYLKKDPSQNLEIIGRFSSIIEHLDDFYLREINLSSKVDRKTDNIMEEIANLFNLLSTLLKNESDKGLERLHKKR